MQDIAPYAVPGVVPGRDGGPVKYRGEQLQATDAVAAALDRGPQEWPALFDSYGDDDEFDTITRDNLCELLYLSTQDGTTWDLWFEVPLTTIVKVEPDEGEDDLIEQALAAQPDVTAARHADVDWFQVGTARVLRADEMLARFIDALIVAHNRSA